MKTLKYKMGFVVFLDVLGFKNMVKQGKNILIKKYLDIVYENIENLKNIDSKKNINYIVISDSIILSVDTTDEKNENIEIFRNLCLAVGLIQESLALENIWIRGAISIGNIFFDKEKSQIIGDGYIMAYELESQAIYPRVIIDNNIINFLKQDNSFNLIILINTFTANNWNGNILYDWNKNSNVSINSAFSIYSIEKDIPLFIDYLDNQISTYNKLIISPNIIEKEESEEKLNKLIQEIKNSANSSTEIYKKYRWVANYLFSKLRSSPSSFKMKLMEI